MGAGESMFYIFGGSLSSSSMSTGGGKFGYNFLK